MCFISTCIFLTQNGYRSVDQLQCTDILLDDKGHNYSIQHIYKLPEYKVVKMVRILADAINDNLPTKTIYLKPTQYLKLDGQMIKATDLVELHGVAEYEKLHVINFYLLDVDRSDHHSDEINEFVICNGLLVSVYNTHHPLNNRFKKYQV